MYRNDQRRIQYRPRHHYHGETSTAIKKNITCPHEIRTTVVEICSGQNPEKVKSPEEKHWRKLVSFEKDGEQKDIKQADLIIPKFITSITDKKLREKLIREKTSNL